MTTSEISAVVVSFDAASRILSTLERLQSAHPFAEVLLVDSGSQDGTVALVRSRLPAIKVHALPTNLGPCATRNLGLREAKSQFVLLIDDDMELDPSTVRRLLSEIEADERIAIVGPRICFEDDRNVVQYEGGLAHFAGLPHLQNLGQADAPGPPRDVDVVSSGCMLVRREHLLKLRGFDDAYFYLMEDVDLSLRLRYAGYRLRVVPEALAWNIGGSADISLKGKDYPARRVYLHSRNRGMMLLKLYHPSTLVLLLPALCIFEAAWFVFACLSRQPLAFLRGKRDLVLRLSSILRARGEFQPCKRLRDSEILGAPDLSFTRAALSQPLARAFAAILDGVMKVYFAVVRGAIL